MSTSLRKAQKHMRRAKELLNQESQFGFGAGNEKTNDKKIDYWSLLSQKLRDTIFQEVAPNSPCTQVCIQAGLNRQSKDLFLEKCKTCNKHAHLAQNKQMQVRSIPAEQLHEMLKEDHKQILQTRQAKMDPTLLSWMNDIDIIVQINFIDPRDNGYCLKCSIVHDTNGNFTEASKKVLSGERSDLFIYIHENKQHEYLEVRYVLFRDHFPFFCHTYLKWNEIQQLDNDAELKERKMHTQLAQNMQMQVRSIPEEELDAMLTEDHTKILRKRKQKVKDIELLSWMNNIDIIVEVTKIRPRGDGYELQCSIVHDTNGNFTKASERIFPDAFGYQLVMYIQNKHNEHLEVEYLEVRYLWFQDHHPFFCHTYLRWHEIQQLMNHKK